MISDKSALGLGLFGLTPLSTIFKLYGGGGNLMLLLL
jgi:hypothetical protein